MSNCSFEFDSSIKSAKSGNSKRDKSGSTILNKYSSDLDITSKRSTEK